MLSLKEMFDDKSMKSSFLLETCLVHNPTNSWCVDSRCTNHIYNVLQGFQETKRLNEGEMFLTLANRSKILVVAIGVSNLCFGSMVLILEDYLYVPNLNSATYLGRH